MSFEETLNLSFQNLSQFIILYFQNKDDSLLRDAKDFFCSFINSVRKLERVENIEQLLTLLKRNGLYAGYDRAALRVFLKIIHEDEFSELVEKHNELLNKNSGVVEPIRNIYAERRKENEARNPQLQVTSSSTALTFTLRSSLVDSKRNEIFKLISRSISTNDFRRLARQLNFREHEIKNLEVSVMEQETRSMVMLRKYEEKEQRIDFNKFVAVLTFLGLKTVAEEVREILKRNES